MEHLALEEKCQILEAKLEANEHKVCKRCKIMENTYKRITEEMMVLQERLMNETLGVKEANPEEEAF